ncbi:MAG: hypothetical protein HZB92_00705 [Euryarchaeota archaeon]|nr:hypothetical protein [Euryarchaeota archaeon]
MSKANKLWKARVALPRRELQQTTEAIHKLGCVQLIDFKENDGPFRIGTPLRGADETSRQLVKIRGMLKALGVEQAEPTAVVSDPDVDAWLRDEMPSVDSVVSAYSKERGELESRTDDMEGELALLEPLEALPAGIRFDLENAVTLAGIGRKNTEALVLRELRAEVSKAKVKGGWAFAFLIDKRREARLREILTALNFKPIEVPPFKGALGERMRHLRAELPKARKRLGELDAQAKELCGKWSMKLLAAEEVLALRLEKLQAPLRFGTTDHFTVIEGWVRWKDAERVKAALGSIPGVPTHVEILEPGVADEPPVVMNTPRPIYQFEFLQKMYSVPLAKEIDPTVILAITFSIFFGLMIGDFGYGLLLITLGWLLRKRTLFGIGGKAVGEIIMTGGIFATIFGLFLFGDALGIPFNPPPLHPDEYSWSGIFGVQIPITSYVHKLEAGGVIHLMIFSIFAGVVHMGLGLVIGAYNQRHEAKHVAAKAGWMLTMIGFFLLVMKMAEKNDLGGWLTGTFMFNIQSSAFPVFGIQIPYLTPPLLVIGAIVLVITEGYTALLEMISMLSSIMSYIRLAAIGVAKAAIAFAFNLMILPMVLGGVWYMVPIGIALFAGAHVFLLLLGALSSGIQALRLNYVEFFQKFYEGGGTAFVPFAGSRRYTKE